MTQLTFDFHYAALLEAVTASAQPLQLKPVETVETVYPTCENCHCSPCEEPASALN